MTRNILTPSKTFLSEHAVRSVFEELVRLGDTPMSSIFSKSKVYKIFGPPGTGKTTKLVSMIEKRMNRTGSRDACMVSFSKSAVEEITSRFFNKTDQHLLGRTVHSLCSSMSRDGSEIHSSSLHTWRRLCQAVGKQAYVLRIPNTDVGVLDRIYESNNKQLLYRTLGRDKDEMEVDDKLYKRLVAQYANVDLTKDWKLTVGCKKRRVNQYTMEMIDRCPFRDWDYGMFSTFCEMLDYAVNKLQPYIITSETFEEMYASTPNYLYNKEWMTILGNNDLQAAAVWLWEFRKMNGYMSFSDMLVQALTKNIVTIPASYDHVRQLYVDECQDLSKLQWLCLDRFVGEHGKIKRVYSVGDDDQTIFRFGGADPQDFLTLRSTKEMQLKTSYRLPQRAFKFSKKYIEAANIDRVKKKFQPLSSNPKGKLKEIDCDGDEAMHKMMKRLHRIAKAGETVLVLTNTNKAVAAIAKHVADDSKTIFIPHAVNAQSSGRFLEDEENTTSDRLARVTRLYVEAWFEAEIPFTCKCLEHPHYAGFAIKHIENYKRSDFEKKDLAKLKRAVLCPNGERLMTVPKKLAPVSEKILFDVDNTKERTIPMFISTVHMAKGKECQHVVFIRTRPTDDPRVEYVAYTRTKETLTIIDAT